MSSIYFQHEVRKYLEEMRLKVDSLKMESHDSEYFQEIFYLLDQLLEEADLLEGVNEQKYREVLNDVLVLRLKAFLRLDDLIAQNAKRNFPNL